MSIESKTCSASIAAAAFLAVGFVFAPIQFSSNGIEISTASAVHGTVLDGNNGHGNNRNDAGEKADDQSNPAYLKREALGPEEDDTDGNSGFGDDKKQDKQDKQDTQVD